MTPPVHKKVSSEHPVDALAKSDVGKDPRGQDRHDPPGEVIGGMSADGETDQEAIGGMGADGQVIDAPVVGGMSADA